MNEDYFDLDDNVLQLLLVSCVNQDDQTRLASNVNTRDVKLGNTYLEDLMQEYRLRGLICKYAGEAAKLESVTHHPALNIDLALIASAKKSDSTAAKGATQPPSSLRPPLSHLLTQPPHRPPVRCLLFRRLFLR